MSDLIGKEVYVEVQEDSYAYSPKLSFNWAKGKIVAVFIGGDVLVEQDKDNELSRHAQEDIAFTDEAPPN